jgi:protein translocase SecG subunit
MTLESQSVLAIGWADLLWNLGAVAVFFLGVLMVVVILIQESKESGLGGAFGAGLTGDSLLGARGQKEIGRFTAVLAGVFALLIIVLGVTANPNRVPVRPGDEASAPPAAMGPAVGSEEAAGDLEEPEAQPTTPATGTTETTDTTDTTTPSAGTSDSGTTTESGSEKESGTLKSPEVKSPGEGSDSEPSPRQ